MINSDTKSVADKIRKLLKIVACESASAAEKETALYQASRLSAKHAINLDALGDEATDFGSTVLEKFGARSPSWCLPVSMVLSEFFNVRCFISREPSPRGGLDAHWHAFGCESSREVAVYVWTFLKREFLRLAKRERPLQLTNFYISIACGLAYSLREKREREDRAMAAGMIHLSDRTDDAYRKFCELLPMQPTKVPKFKPNQRAFDLGRQIQVKPGLGAEMEPQLCLNGQELRTV